MGYRATVWIVRKNRQTAQNVSQELVQFTERERLQLKKTTARQKQHTFEEEISGPATHTDDSNTFLLKKLLFSFVSLTVVQKGFKGLIPSDSSNLNMESSNLEAVSRPQQPRT